MMKDLNEYPETVVSKLEFLKDVTDVHGEIKHLISKDYVFANIQEEKKEPLAKLISQFYYAYWLKTTMVQNDESLNEEKKKEVEKQIRKQAQADLDRQLIQYNIYAILRRNMNINPMVELIVMEGREREEENEPLDHKRTIKEMLRIGKKGKEDD